MLRGARLFVTVVGVLTFFAFIGATPLAAKENEKDKPTKGDKAPHKTAAAGAIPEPPATGSSKEDLAAFLVKPAEAALAERKFALAISLFRGIVAIRGDGDAVVWKLAEAWTLAGEFESASEELERYLGAVTDRDEEIRARQHISELAERPKGFGGRVFEVQPATAQAGEAFKRGRKFFTGKKFPEAVLMFKAGIVMAPDLPGNYRELGEAFDKLGRSGEANDFFVRYLKIRPFGKNADTARKRLEKAGMVGKLSVETSFPCEQVWMNRQPMPSKLPVKTMIVAPGKYKLLCYTEKFHLAHYVTVEVPKGAAAQTTFAWAVLENKLEPWGRVVMENPENPGEMTDIGVWTEVGVPMPSDRRALRIVMKAGDGSKNKELFLKIEPGKRIPLQW
jgi:tetratricopeptide (TPR) repeat protein